MWADLAAFSSVKRNLADCEVYRGAVPCGGLDLFNGVRQECSLRHSARLPASISPNTSSLICRPASNPALGRIFVSLRNLLVSPEFWRNLGSGGETESLHPIGILSFDDEFREAVAQGGIQEKFRHALAQRIGHDQLGGRDAGADGSQPGAEGVPDTLRKGDGQVLKQSLADHRRLDEDMVGVQLAPDGVAVVAGGAMEVLVAAAAAHGLHLGHPEVVAERADQPHRLLERMLDLEAQAVEANDLTRHS